MAGRWGSGEPAGRAFLVAEARWRGNGGGGTVLGLLLALGLAQVAEAQVTVPHTFANGSGADADAMSANFTAVENGVNAALSTGSVTVPHTFTNGTTANADEVNANFTAVVDGVNTALANRATDCAGAGGTWNAGTSTCTPSYNCFIGGFCAQAAIEAPPGDFGYTNLYDGHTQGTEPALSAGCNTFPAAFLSGDGHDLAVEFLSPPVTREPPLSPFDFCATN
jgi:hypothetical protein